MKITSFLALPPSSAKSPHLHLFTEPKFLHQLLIVGVALMAVSLLYLVGANWFMIADAVKIALPMVLMVISAVASLWVSDAMKSVFETVSGAMIGLSLAVIGQVYQTGADSFWLFAIWSVLLLPWCYRCNIAIFILLSVVSQLAVFLYIDQTTFDASFLFIIMSVLALLQFWVATRYYPILINGFALVFGVISVASAFALDDGAGLPAAISLFLAPSVCFLYAKKHEHQLATSLSLVGLGTGLFAWFLINVVGQGDELLKGIIAMIWFGVIGFMVLKLFPKGRFHAVPLAFGGWLAGLLISWGMLFSTRDWLLVVGLIWLLIGGVLLKRLGHQAFVRHLGYTLFAVGQIAFYYGVWQTVFSYDVERVVQYTDILWMMTILQSMVVLAVIGYFRLHWIYVLLQSLAWYGLVYQAVMMGMPSEYAIQATNDGRQALLFALAVLPLLGLTYQHHLAVKYQRALAIFVMVMMVLWASFRQSMWAGFEMMPSEYQLYASLPIIAAVLYRLRHHQDKLALVLFGVLALILGMLGYITIFVALLLLMLAIHRQDKLWHALAVMLLVGLLWQLYYLLAVPFLVKFITILLSGILVAALALLLKKRTSVQELA